MKNILHFNSVSDIDTSQIILGPCIVRVGDQTLISPAYKKGNCRYGDYGIREVEDTVPRRLSVYGDKVSIVIQPDCEIWYKTTDGNIFDVTESENWPWDVEKNENVGGICILRNVGKQTVDYLCESAFDNDYDPNRSAGRITEMYLPETVEYLDTYAFYNQNALTTIRLPDRINSIGRWTFKSCESLTSLIMPANLKQIMEGAFNYCTNLKYISFEKCSGTTMTNYVVGGYSQQHGISSPKSFIENGVFTNAPELTTVYLPGNYNSQTRIQSGLSERACNRVRNAICRSNNHAREEGRNALTISYNYPEDTHHDKDDIDLYFDGPDLYLTIKYLSHRTRMFLANHLSDHNSLAHFCVEINNSIKGVGPKDGRSHRKYNYYYKMPPIDYMDSEWFMNVQITENMLDPANWPMSFCLGDVSELAASWTGAGVGFAGSARLQSSYIAAQNSGGRWEERVNHFWFRVNVRLYDDAGVGHYRRTDIYSNEIRKEIDMS